MDSICSQTYKDWELILVDDGSTDKSSSICDAYAQKDSRIHVIHQKNSGVVAARNAGIRRASRDYCCFVDSDDWVSSNWLNNIALTLNEHPNDDVIICNYTLVKDENKILVKNHVAPGIYKEKQLDVIRKGILYDENVSFFNESIIPTLWSKVFRTTMLRQAIEKVKKPISMGEDLLLSVFAIDIAQQVEVLDQAFYFYLENTSSVSFRYRKNALEDVLLFASVLHTNLDLSKNNYNNQLAVSLLNGYIMNLRAIVNNEKQYRIVKNECLRWFNQPIFEQIKHAKVDKASAKMQLFIGMVQKERIFNLFLFEHFLHFIKRITRVCKRKI